MDPNLDRGGGNRFANTFDAYVKPSNNAVWSQFVTNVHGLHNNHPLILSADILEVVWKKISTFINDNIQPKHQGVLVAWNGETCDME